MLRKFIQCKNVEERAALIQSTSVEDWSDEELKVVMEIVGLKAEDAKDKKSMIDAVCEKLSSNAKEEMPDEFLKHLREEADKIDDTISEKEADVLLMSFKKATDVKFMSEAFKKDF